MSAMQIELDLAVRALYIALTDRPTDKTVEVQTDRVFVDFDAGGEVVGIEILGVKSDQLPALLDEVQSILKDVIKTTGRELPIGA